MNELEVMTGLYKLIVNVYRVTLVDHYPILLGNHGHGKVVKVVQVMISLVMYT